MSDIALTWDPSELVGDFGIEANDLETDDGFQTACLLSWFCDAYDEESKTGGWWGDSSEVAIVAGDRFGSRRHLLARSKNDPKVLQRAIDYGREAYQWVIDDKIAERVDVISERLPGNTGYAVQVTIPRPDKSPTSFRFVQAWAAEQERQS